MTGDLVLDTGDGRRRDDAFGRRRFQTVTKKKQFRFRSRNVCRGAKRSRANAMFPREFGETAVRFVLLRSRRGQTNGLTAPVRASLHARDAHRRRLGKIRSSSERYPIETACGGHLPQRIRRFGRGRRFQMAAAALLVVLVVVRQRRQTTTAGLSGVAAAERAHPQRLPERLSGPVD